MNEPPEDNSENHSEDRANGLRIGHAEREAAFEVLRDAASSGRITFDELESRIERIDSARYATDIAEVLGDITTDLPWEHARSTVTDSSSQRLSDSAPGWSSEEREVLHSPWSGLIRRGRWTVVPFIRCEPAGVLLELNFLDVITDLTIIDIEVSARTGTLKLVVPDDWGVDITALKRSPVAVITFKADEAPQEGSPMVRVHGQLGSGVFQARGPSRRRRRLDK